jgi:hypothetical protein
MNNDNDSAAVKATSDDLLMSDVRIRPPLWIPDDSAQILANFWVAGRALRGGLGA